MEISENFEDPAGKEQFFKTTKIAGTRFFGRESLLQVKKRIGGEGTKVPHHRRTMTDSNKNLSKFASAAKFTKRRGSEEKVQIIESLDNPDIEECKSDLDSPKIDKMAEKIDRQIKQAEELIAKVTQDRIEIDELDLDNGEGGNELNESMVASENVEEEEKEMEVTVGEILKDIAVLVTNEYHLFAWPLDMLPKDIKKGVKFSFLVKWNGNSEVLRKNAIYTQQNEILKLLQKE